MFVYPKDYDVIVVGGGHAGIEAALAASRMGCQTLLLTMNLDTIGQMSCNPAIGGLGKGHLVREIDALGGEMGRNTDLTGLHFRMLNLKKGPSVWSPRAQCDKKAYQFRLKWICEKQENLDCKQGLAIRVLTQASQICGVETALEVVFMGKAVVLTTGTFLRGLMHVGANQQSGGRAGEAASDGLSASLKQIGLELGRLKTGTPPRLLRRSIDFSKTQPQLGDEPVPYFSHWRGDLFHVEHAADHPTSRYPVGSLLASIGAQLPCYITYTTEKTAEAIKSNLHRSPLYAGAIQGVGPRYCPSIEDKIVRFPEKDRHQLFLEPEGVSTEEIYLNGFSTSLPLDLQIQIVRTVVGCERAEILRPAYAVEYDFAFPTQLQPSLESKCCPGLFLAGQINGTSGYEEAAAQGLLAGINAARRVRIQDPIILARDQAYIGVLIDDLVTKGTVEPYRMFTSRAEYRLLLRQDNADMRLSDLGHKLGLLPELQFKVFDAKRNAVYSELRRLSTTRSGTELLSKILARPDVHYQDLPCKDDSITQEVAQQVELDIKYAGYIERQQREIHQVKSLESHRIPHAFDYGQIAGLRTEARLKLNLIRPVTLGQASRISGVSPADLTLLRVWLRRTQGDTPEPDVSHKGAIH